MLGVLEWGGWAARARKAARKLEGTLRTTTSNFEAEAVGQEAFPGSTDGVYCGAPSRCILRAPQHDFWVPVVSLLTMRVIFRMSL